MANNYLQFSQIIERITKEEAQWLDENYFNPQDKFDDEGARFAWGKRWGIREDDIEFWPDFDMEFRDDGRTLWIYTEESGNPSNVAIFVQNFLKRFRPKEIFVMNWAETCSKLRVEEFGGGCIVVTAAEIYSMDSYTWADRKFKEITDGN